LLASSLALLTYLLTACTATDAGDPFPRRADASWTAGTERTGDRNAYEFGLEPSGLSASNPAHNLHILLADRGIQVFDRTTGGNPLLFSVRLHAFGREKKMSTLPPGEVLAGDERVERIGNSTDRQFKQAFRVPVRAVLFNGSIGAASGRYTRPLGFQALGLECKRMRSFEQLGTK
jgi:hypothetical protein